MKKITDDDIITINKLYLQYGTYSGVAQAMGISASTVKKYVFPGYLPDDNTTRPAVITDNDWNLDDIEDFADLGEENGCN